MSRTSNPDPSRRDPGCGNARRLSGKGAFARLLRLLKRQTELTVVAMSSPFETGLPVNPLKGTMNSSTGCPTLCTLTTGALNIQLYFMTWCAMHIRYKKGHTMPAEYSSLGSRPNLAFLKPLCKVAAIPAAIPADQED